MNLVSETTIADARATDLVPLIEGYGVKLSKQGADYFGLCPFHNEKSESFTVNPGKGFYHCFGCGAHGDPIAFVQEFEGVGFRDAVQKLVGDLPADAKPRAKRDIEREERDEWVPMNPVPADVPKPKDILYREYKGKRHKLVGNLRWEYRNADGSLIGYVYRFDEPGGGKVVMPQVYCTNQKTGELEWRWLSFPKPRPLYGLDKLAANPNAQVIVVEGEKTCDAAQARFAEVGVTESMVVVVSWPGGGKAVKHADFSPLWGRRVGLWPDADLKVYVDTPAKKHPKAGEVMPFLEQPGTVAMLDIFDAIRAECEGVKFFVPPAGVPDGWDLADPFPEGFNLRAHAKTARWAESVRAGAFPVLGNIAAERIVIGDDASVRAVLDACKSVAGREVDVYQSPERPFVAEPAGVVVMCPADLTAAAQWAHATNAGADIVIVVPRDAESESSTWVRNAYEAGLTAGARLMFPEWSGAPRTAADILRDGFEHTWTDDEGGEQTISVPGDEHLVGCVQLASPCRSRAFLDLIRLCGITDGDLQRVDADDVADAAAVEDGQAIERAQGKPSAAALGSLVATENSPADVHLMNQVHFSDWPHLSDKMKPLNTIPNLRRLLDNYGFTVRYDVIRKDIIVRYPGQRGTTDNQREAAVNTVLSLCSLNRLPKAEVPGYMLSIADSNPVNPVMDFITSKPWDGRSRLDDLLATVKTRPGFDRSLYAMLMRRWFISAVAAAAKPSGFWSKGVVVFQGAQSLGKTAWFRSLLPADLRELLKVDATIDPNNKDTVISAVSHWLVELGELDGTLRKADIARLKGFITQDVDQFRRPYGRSEEKVQRRTVFFASVNPEQFLVDDANVRWWTVPVLSVDSQHGIDMQQFWAEVFEWYKSGERWWLEPSEESRLEEFNASHTQTDPVEELIISRYASASAGNGHKLMTASEVLLRIGYDRPTQKQRQDAGKALRKLFGEPEHTKVGRCYKVPILDAYAGGREQF